MEHTGDNGREELQTQQKHQSTLKKYRGQRPTETGKGDRKRGETGGIQRNHRDAEIEGEIRKWSLRRDTYRDTGKRQ